MLPKANRLKKKKDFERVFKEGKGFREDFLFFKIAKNNSGINRFAFIVGKKLSRKATVRNKMRRCLSALVRQKLKNLKSGHDAIFLVFPGAEKREFLEIGKTIDNLFAKAKLLK